MEPYTNIGFDGLFDFSFYYGVNRGLGQGTGIPTLSKMLQESHNSFDDVQRVTLIDNHDLPRFNSGTALHNWTLEKLALEFMMTTPGIPMLYYGTEIGMSGTNFTASLQTETQDYFNRISYPETLSKSEISHFEDTQNLISLRLRHPALQCGNFYEIYKDLGVYAYLRQCEKEALLVVMNSSEIEDFVGFDLTQQLGITKIGKQIYGDGVLREMDEGLYFRLPSTSLSIWEIQPAKDLDSLKIWVELNSRIPKSFQMVELPIWGIQSANVKIAGDFNNWQPQAYSQNRVGENIIISFPLKPGRYAYKIVVDDTNWLPDSHNPNFEIDPFGGENSILIIEK